MKSKLNQSLRHACHTESSPGVSPKSRDKGPLAAECDPEQELFTIREAAQYLDCTVFGVQLLIVEEKIPVIKNGRRVRIKRDDLDRVPD